MDQTRSKEPSLDSTMPLTVSPSAKPTKDERGTSHITDGKVFPFFELPRELRDWIYDYCFGDAVKIPISRHALGLPEVLPNNAIEAENEAEDKDASETEEDDSDEEVHDSDYEYLEALLGHAILSVAKPALPHLLCTSRAIKSEYEKRINNLTTLNICDNHEYEFTPPALQGRLVKLQKMHFSIATRCFSCLSDASGPQCGAVKDIRSTVELINQVLLQMPHVKSISVTFGIQWTPEALCMRWPTTVHSGEMGAALERITKVPKVSAVDVYRCGPKEWEVNHNPSTKDMYVSWTKTDGWRAPEEQHAAGKS